MKHNNNHNNNRNNNNNNNNNNNYNNNNNNHNNNNNDNNNGNNNNVTCLSQLLVVLSYCRYVSVEWTSMSLTRCTSSTLRTKGHVHSHAQD